MKERRTIPTFMAAVIAAMLIAAPGHTILEGQPTLATLSADLTTLVAGGSTTAVPVIVRGPRADVLAAAGRLNLEVVRLLDEFVVLRANAAAIRQLQQEPSVHGMSGDLPVIPAMWVSNRAMAADQTRAGQLPYLGVTGRGIGVAIVDSGITPHPALGNRVVAAVSFVPGEPSPHDGFGHGTHIAGIIAGDGTVAAGIAAEYDGGIAPGAHLINVKVLGRDGAGRTSDVIAGIDWVIANRARFGIRIVNLSLGHPVTEPSLTDPLNATVARAVAAGILVVASAGNRGRTADGRPMLGSITSPGNSLHALTTGALNTWGTISRADDTVTTYSSRGPTEYEFALKPDVVAPGNKIVSLEAIGSTLANLYPAERVAGPAFNAYRRMSGTSMAAGMVSGAAALLFEAAPALTPRHVKVLLQAGASVMLREGLVASGAGHVDTWASRRIAADGPSDLLPSSTVGGLSFRAGGLTFSDGGRLIDRLYRQVGLNLLSTVDLLFVWGDLSRLPDDRVNLFGLAHVLAQTPATQMVWGDMSQWASGSQVIWGDQMINPSGQQVIWGDTDTSEGYQVIWGDTQREP